MLMQTPPLSLYIHIPWCISKCPYCDFNSHKMPVGLLPEEKYNTRLLQDLAADIDKFANIITNRNINSIFIGGGTPSLLQATTFTKLLTGIKQQLKLTDEVEITLEANPGTVEQQRFYDYRQLGINRLSLGIQSFNDTALQRLGRVHDANATHNAIDTARLAGFDNINIDIMYGLPMQTHAQALTDLQIAISKQPEHISWYQLTLEPNTMFHKKPPQALPTVDELADMEQPAYELFTTHGYHRYEISAYAKNSARCRHNMNYWQFGDYLGIGAGAHSKLTDVKQQRIIRLQKLRQPHSYLNAKQNWVANEKVLDTKDILFEFMLNALRLQQAIPFTLLEQRTGINRKQALITLQKLEAQQLVIINKSGWQLTSMGKKFTDDVVSGFL